MPELELKIRLLIDRCRYGEETILMDTKKAAKEIRLLFEKPKIITTASVIPTEQPV